MQYGEDNIKTETWKIPVFTLSDKVFKYGIVRFPSRPSQLLLSVSVKTPSPLPTWHEHKHIECNTFIVFIRYPQLPTCAYQILCLKREVGAIESFMCAVIFALFFTLLYSIVHINNFIRLCFRLFGLLSKCTQTSSHLQTCFLQEYHINIHMGLKAATVLYSTFLTCYCCIFTLPHT